MRPASNSMVAGVFSSAPRVRSAGSTPLSDSTWLEQLGHAGAFRPQVDFQALQFVQLVRLDAVAQEQPDRLGEQAAQRHQALALRFGLVGGAALHKGDIDLALLQLLQIVLRAQRTAPG